MEFSIEAPYLSREVILLIPVLYAVNTNPAAKQYEDAGINIMIGDQLYLVIWTKLVVVVKNFDVVVDNGGDLTNYMISVPINAFYEHTNNFYVADDTHALCSCCVSRSFFRDCVYAFTSTRSIKKEIHTTFKSFKSFLFFA